MKQERSLIASLIKYITEFDTGNILYKAFPVKIVGGSSGGSTSPTDIATGIDQSNDVETIRLNSATANTQLTTLISEVNTLDTQLGNLEITVGKIEDYTEIAFNPAPVTINVPLSGSIPVTLPKTGFYQLRVTTGNLDGGLTLTSNGISLVLNTGTIQTENIQGAYRDYYLWTGTTTLTLNAGSNTTPATLVFTPIPNAPDIADSFSGFIGLAAGGSSSLVSCRGFSYLHIDNLNFGVTEKGVGFTTRYAGWMQLRGTSFTITNTAASSQVYYFKLSNTPNNAATNSLLDSAIKTESAPSLNRLTIAGVTSAGLVKAPVLDSSGRFQVVETNSPTIVTNTAAIATVLNKDSLDYSVPFTVYASVSSTFTVATPVNRYILKSVYCRNNSPNSLFLQLFNKSSVPVTGDIPLLSIRVLGDAALFLGSDFFAPKGFLLPNIASGSVYWCQSSTEAIFTPATNSISITSLGIDRII